MTICIDIPGLRLESEANSRSHWSGRAARVKGQRDVVSMVLAARVGRKALELLGAESARVPLDVTITRIAPRKLDQGGNLYASAKAVQDEVAQLLGVDDRKEQQVRYVVEQSSRGREYGTEIKIAPRGAP